jgi:hypothetical protein
MEKVMDLDKLDAIVDDLVDTRYPYQVEAILKELDQRDLVTVVAAALARSLEQGFKRGEVAARTAIRERLGL